MDTTTTLSPDDNSPPLLKLGLAGFCADRRAQIEHSLRQHTGGVRWALLPLMEADAWLVHGPQVQVLLDGSLRVHPALPTERVVRLQLGAMDRPVGFFGPLPADIEPLCTFDLDVPASTEAALLRMSGWLMGKRVQYLLGREIVARGAALRHGVFHLSLDDRLLAVLDFRRGTAALRPQLHPSDLARARWERRPSTAGGSPPGFTSVGLRQLCWLYASRTNARLLPARYREAQLYFRQPPRVQANELRDSHLMVLSALSKRPGTLQELVDRTGLTADRLEQDLASLYFGGAITTTPAKAAQPRHGIAAGVSSRPWLDETNENLSPVHARRFHASGTVPMTLAREA